MFKRFFTTDAYFFPALRTVLWVLAFCFLLAPLNVVRQDTGRAEAKRNALRPRLSAEKLFAMREDILKLTTVVSDDPEEIYRIGDLKHYWEAAVEVHGTGGMWGKNSEDTHNRLMLQNMAGAMQSSTSDLFARYERKHGKVVIQRAANTYAPKRLPLPWDEISTEWSPGYGPLVLKCLGLFALMTFMVMLTRFWQRNALDKVMYSLPRMVLLSPLGPIGDRLFDVDNATIIEGARFYSFALNMALAACAPAGMAVSTHAQSVPAAPGKGKTTISRSSTNSADSGTESGQGINNLPLVLKRLGISQVDAEVLPGAGPKLREFALEASFSRKFGKDGAKGLFTDFSFVEVTQTVFQNNSFAFFPGEQRFLAPAGETGYSQTARAGFLSVGGKVVLSKTPGVSKVVKKGFDFAALSYLHRASGAAPTQQLVFVYDTRAVRIGHWVRILGSGFWRYRMRTAINYGQQTFRIQVGSWTRFEPIVQFSTAGKTVGISAGVKLYLFPVR